MQRLRSSEVFSKGVMRPESVVVEEESSWPLAKNSRSHIHTVQDFQTHRINEPVLCVYTTLFRGSRVDSNLAPPLISIHTIYSWDASCPPFFYQELIVRDITPFESRKIANAICEIEVSVVGVNLLSKYAIAILSRIISEVRNKFSLAIEVTVIAYHLNQIITYSYCSVSESRFSALVNVSR